MLIFAKSWLKRIIDDEGRGNHVKKSVDIQQIFANHTYSICNTSKKRGSSIAVPILRRTNTLWKEPIMSLVTAASVSLNIAALTAKEARDGLSALERRQLLALQELARFLPLLNHALVSHCPPAWRDDVQSSVIFKFMQLRHSGKLAAVPPGSYAVCMVKTALANSIRHARRAAGILDNKQVSYPVNADTVIKPVALVADNGGTSFEYADSRFTTDAMDNWLHNYSLVAAYFRALVHEMDKAVLWALWQYKCPPRELARHLGCQVTQVYAALRRIRSLSKAVNHHVLPSARPGA